MFPPTIMSPGLSPPQTCPSCQRLEDKKVTCRHCGHEYKNRSSREARIMVSIFLLFCGGLAGFLYWLFNYA